MNRFLLSAALLLVSPSYLSQTFVSTAVVPVARSDDATKITDLGKRGEWAFDKSFYLVVNNDYRAPDGFSREYFTINDKMPADPLIFDENDEIEIVIFNNSTYPFAEHWHGIFQHGTPESDGVPGVTQWNIYPGESYTYRFNVSSQYGAYWHHAHERGYYADGLRGPLYIRPKADRAKPWSLISNNSDDIAQMEEAEQNYSILLMQDNWHITHDEMTISVHETGVPPGCMDSLLLNGKGRVYCAADWAPLVSPAEAALHTNYSYIMQNYTSKGCVSIVPPIEGYDALTVLDTDYGGPCKNTSAALDVFNAGDVLAAGRKYMNIQVIDSATNWYYGLSIDSHKMWIVAVDGSYVQPQLVDFAEITIGSRISLMIELDDTKTGDYPIRMTSTRALQAIEGMGFLSYDSNTGSSKDLTIDEGFAYLLDRTNASVSFSGTVKSDATQFNVGVAYPFEAPEPVPKYSNVTIHAVSSETALNVWQLASQPMDINGISDDEPMIFAPNNISRLQPTQSIPLNSVVDLILENPTISFFGGPNSPHPFHLHGHKFYIIGTGSGTFEWDTIAEAEAAGVVFNLDNPPLRDGFDVGPSAWVAFRYIADSPAANMLHCHINDHLQEGMAAVLLEGLDQLPTFKTNLTTKPSGWFPLSNDTVGKILEEGLELFHNVTHWTTPAADDTWGDPRSAASAAEISAASVKSASLESVSAAAATTGSSTTGRASRRTAMPAMRTPL